MSYTITKSDGTVLATIVDGTVDNSTAIQLAGPNTTGYGQTLNENLVHILENFASGTAPGGDPLQGQLWFDKTNQSLQVWTDVGYVPVSGSTVGNSAPSSPKEGEIWLNTDTNQTYIYDGSAWRLIGPQYTKAQGVSGAIPATSDDQADPLTTHNILKLQFGDKVIAILSSDLAFTPGTAIDGFPRIYPGITVNTEYFTNDTQFYTDEKNAVYLPTDTTIIGIQSNISSLNSALSTQATYSNVALTTANTAMKSYVDDAVTTINSRIDTEVTTLNSSIAANVDTLTTAINGVQTNVDNLTASTTANAGALADSISATNTNWTANAVSQQGQINTLINAVYTNSNTASYLTSYGGDILAANVTARTQEYTDKSTKVATTEFVQNILPQGAIIMWGGSASAIPFGWLLCNGSNGTPDLRNRFIVGAGSTYSVGATGGNASVTLSSAQMPVHTHSISASATTSSTEHTHTVTDNGHTHNFKDYYGAVDDAGGGIPTPIGSNAIDAYNNFDGDYDSGGLYVNSRTNGGTTGIAVSGGSHTHTISISDTTGSAGGSSGITQPHENLPPYYALCYIQKVV